MLRLRILVVFLTTLLLTVLPSFASSAGAVTLDFVDVPMVEVARTLSRAYGMSILTDDAGDVRVTFHLENVSFFEGLTALCAANGLAVVQEGNVFHIRRAHLQGGSIVLSDSGVVVSVRQMNVREFVREFGLNTGLNVLADYDVEGNVSGDLRGMLPEVAFRVLMESNGFKVRGERGCLRVSRKTSIASRTLSEGASSGGVRNKAEINVERAGDLYSVDLQMVSLREALQAIAKEAELNLAIYGELKETVQLSFKDIPLPELLTSISGECVYLQDGFFVATCFGRRGDKGFGRDASLSVEAYFTGKGDGATFETHERDGYPCFGISGAECTCARGVAACA